jgi:cytochrome oxidase Cu insertion factor (SCO1/SenC/PrrC family)
MFFYTECQGTCPGTTQAMKRLRQSVADEFPGEQLRFVSITLDPEHDTPQDLLAYAEAHGVRIRKETCRTGTSVREHAMILKPSAVVWDCTISTRCWMRIVLSMRPC